MTWKTGRKTAASAGLLWLILRRMDLSSVGAVLAHVRWEWLAAALGVMLISRVLSCLRLLLLVRAKALPHEAPRVAQIVLVSEFYGVFLPTSMGGDVVRIYQLSRYTGNTSESAAAVFMERAIGVIGLLALGAVGAVWAWPYLDQRQVIWMALLPALSGLLIALAALNERWVVVAIHRIGQHRSRWVKKLLEWQNAVRAYRHHRRALFQAFVVTIGIHALRVASIYLVGLALGDGITIAMCLGLVPLILLVSLLPISIGGFGVRENAFVHLFGQFGIAPELSFSVSLVAHTLSVLAHVPGGIWWALAGPDPSRERQRPVGNSRPVLWVSDKLGYGDTLHGGGRYYLTVVPALRASAVEIIPAVLRSTNGLASQFTSQGIVLRQFRRGQWDPRTLWSLIRCIRQEGVGVLHLHGYGASTFGRLAGWLTRTPVIVHQHDLSARAPWYGRLLDRLLSPLTTRVIAVSEPVKRFCVTERALPAERITVLPNGIPPLDPPTSHEMERWRAELDLSPQAKLVGSVTRFYPIKGVRYLIEAMPKVRQAVPEAYFVLWGDGPDREALEVLARKLGVADRIRFAGYQPDASRRLALVDCAVLSSLSEGFPFVLLEAMALGRPVVATRVGGIPEIVGEDEALLVEPANADALADAVVRVLREPTLAARLAQAAMQASRRYTMDRHVAGLRQVYAGVSGAA